MSDDSLDSPLDLLAEEFAQRYRRGERPSLTEFVEQHPEFGTEIRELFPALVMMEKARSGDGLDRPTGPHAADFGSEPHGGRIGDFRVIREVGRGGMGIVYEAMQESLGRHVALKILPVSVEKNPRHLLRFQREARAAAKLHHPNIVPVFGVGESDGRHFYAMQFIHGLGLDEVAEAVRRIRQNRARSMSDDPGPKDASVEVLAEALLSGNFRATATPDTASGECEPLRERPLAASSSVDVSDSEIRLPGQSSTMSSADNRRAYWDSVARIGIQVSEALQYASDEGVLHRDIKPANLLLDLKGTVWVADFGLAKSDESDALTNPGDILGTLRYMAPERFQGQSDLRSDIYSLGTTLYEMLTLRPTFEHSDRNELIRKISQADPPRPRSIDRTIPLDLETIVLKAISKARTDRYQTAVELASDLRQFLEDKPILARPIGPLERAWRWCRRNPRVALLLGSVALLLVIVAAGSFTAAVWLKHERDLARASEQRAATAEKGRRQELYRAYLNEARATYITGRQGQRVNGVHAIKNILAAFPPNELSDGQQAELRDEAISYLALADLRQVSRLPRIAGERFQADINDTLEVYAHRGKGVVGTVLTHVDGSRGDIELQSGERDPRAVSTELFFSDSGRWLAEIDVIPTPEGDRRLRVWDWQSARIAVEMPVLFAGTRIAFHPDDRHIMAFGRDATLQLFSLTTGIETSRSPARFRNTSGAFSPDGKLFAIASPDLMAEIIDPTTWQTVAAIPEAGPTFCVAWNPVEQYLVFGADDGRLYVWDYVLRRGYFISGGHAGRVLGLKFSPDGRLLASSGNDNMIHLRYMDGDRMLLRIRGEALRFSRDGKRLAAHIDNDLVVYERVDSSAYTSIRMPVDAADFSPDGNWLAMAHSRGVWLYSAQLLTLKGELALDHCGPVAFHPDGKSLLTFGIFSHLWNWSLSPPQAGEQAWQLGPPQPVLPRLLKRELFGTEAQRTGRHAAWSRDGRVLAIADYRYDQVFVTDSKAEAPPRKVAELLSVARVAVSPDGRWIAGASHHYKRACVWRTDDGQTMLDIPDQGQVAFSPDGKWFASSSLSQVQLYRVEKDTPDVIERNRLEGPMQQKLPSPFTLERVFQTDQPPNAHSLPVAFQPNGSLLAAAISARHVRLFDCESGKVVANLTHLEPTHLTWLSFSPDGTRLAVTRAGFDVVVWDLHQLRVDLAEAGIACEELPRRLVDSFDPAPDLNINPGELVSQADHGAKTWRLLALYEAREGRWPDAIDDANRSLILLPAEPRQERAELLTLRGQYNLRNQNARAAREDWQHAIAVAPYEPTAIRSLARLLVFGPPEQRDAERSRALIAGLVAALGPAPEDLLLLGVARVRLDQFQPGLEDLQKVLSVKATQPLALYFIALAQHGLGQAEPAAESLVQAKTAHDEILESLSAEDRDELVRVRAEVEGRLRE